MTEQPEQYFTLDIPQREGKAGYIGTLFGLYLRLGGILADGNFKETDVRIYYMVKLLISLIPGKKNRDTIRKQMKQDLDAALKDVVDNEKRSRLRNEICIEYIGEVHDFVDKHVGVSSENKIGFVVKPR